MNESQSNSMETGYPSQDGNSWIERYPVRTYEVDARGGLSPIAVCDFLQDAGGKHAVKLGLSVRHLLESHQTWMLLRLAVNFESQPGWGSPIEVETWPSGAQKLFALRDYRLTSDGDPVATATSAWLVIDTLTRRPVRMKGIMEKFHGSILEPVMDYDYAKLPELCAPELERTFNVRFADLDVNQHVNNVSYIAWTLESIAPDILASHKLDWLEVNFLGEAMFGDRVLCSCSRMDDAQGSYLHRIVREEDGHELTRAVTRWSEAEPYKIPEKE